MPDPDILPGRTPTTDEREGLKAAKEYWQQVGNEAPATALGRVEEAARQLVGLTGGLQGLYFAVFTLGRLGDRIPAALLWLFLVPVGLWLASLLCATLVFVPRARAGADLNQVSERAWIEIRDTYVGTLAKKLRWLHWGHGLLVGSFLAVALLLGVLVAQPAPLAADPLRVVILTPVPPLTPVP